MMGLFCVLSLFYKSTARGTYETNKSTFIGGGKRGIAVFAQTLKRKKRIHTPKRPHRATKRPKHKKRLTHAELFD